MMSNQEISSQGSPMEVASSQQRSSDSGFNTPASITLLVDASLVFYAIYLLVVGFDILPPRLLDPLWILNASSALVNAVSIPLAGVFFTHVAALLAPQSNRIQERRRLISRLAAWASLGFLLLLPLLGFATWRGVTNVNAANWKQSAGLTRNANRMLAAIESSTSSRELQARMVQLQGPQIRDEDLSQPLEALKKAETQVVKQALNAYLAQLPKPTSQAYKGLYVQTLRTALLALVASFGFAALSWDPLKQKTLLQKFLSPEKKSLYKPSLWFTSAIKAVSKALAPLLAPFKRTPDQQKRQRFWSQWRDKQKRASATRARELKRNAQMIKKAQRERERQRLLKEKKRRREERGKRPGNQQP